MKVVHIPHENITNHTTPLKLQHNHTHTFYNSTNDLFFTAMGYNYLKEISKYSAIIQHVKATWNSLWLITTYSM